MLIIEGSDLVGKTTLAQTLVAHPWFKQSGYVYAHFTRLPDSFDRYHGYVDRSSRRVVQDRYHMSEVVYSHARGDAKKLLDPERYRLVDGYLRSLGAVTVVVTCDERTLRERYRTRHPDRAEMYDEEMTVRVNRIFADGLAKLGYLHVDSDLRLHCTDRQPYPTQTQVEAIVDFYRARQCGEINDYLTFNEVTRRS